MKKVVLIVEDELMLRLDLANEFREAGYVVLEAATAKAAIAVCQEAKAVNLLITDIRLNGADGGWDVAKAFRALWGDVPVIYTSGNAFDGKLSVPNSLFFAKPYRTLDVIGGCQQLLAVQNQ